MQILDSGRLFPPFGIGRMIALLRLINQAPSKVVGLGLVGCLLHCGRASGHDARFEYSSLGSDVQMLDAFTKLANSWWVERGGRNAVG